MSIYAYSPNGTELFFRDANSFRDNGTTWRLIHKAKDSTPEIWQGDVPRTWTLSTEKLFPKKPSEIGSDKQALIHVIERAECMKGLDYELAILKKLFARYRTSSGKFLNQ